MTPKIIPQESRIKLIQGPIIKHPESSLSLNQTNNPRHELIYGWWRYEKLKWIPSVVFSNLRRAAMDDDSGGMWVMREICLVLGWYYILLGLMFMFGPLSGWNIFSSLGFFGLWNWHVSIWNLKKMFNACFKNSVVLLMRWVQMIGWLLIKSSSL